MRNKYQDIQVALAETTKVTDAWIRENMLKEDYGSMQPMLEQALTSVVPASDRAILVRYGCELMGKDWHLALPGMAAFEFQNINLLVTDDYFDERTTKRMGKDPISVKYGPKAAIALGFILKSMSNECLLRGWQISKDWDLQAAIETIEWASKWQYYSQFLEDDLCAKPLSKATLEDYEYLIQIATATGIAGAIELGCIVGGCDNKARKKARAFGLTLGSLLQIRDDCIDYIYNEKLIHKGAFSDIFTKRRRLPLLAAYWEGTGKEQKKILSIINKNVLTLFDAYEIVQLICKPKVQNFVTQYSNKLAARATTQLGYMPSTINALINFKSLIGLFSDF
jgi:octaprenyl-diphosphate synthase